MVRKAEKLAQEAKQAVERWRTYFRYNISQYHEFHEFILGRQWNDDEEDMLKTYKKVPLQFNKLAPLINTLLGEQQQNTPQLQVTPKGNCSERVAEIRQAIVRDSISSSQAKNVYQVAAAQSFIGGFGAFVLGTEYADNKSFDLNIVRHYLKDATRAFWDVSAEEINKTDGMCGGYITRMARKKFRHIYGAKVEEKIRPDGDFAGRNTNGDFQDPSGNNDFVFAFADQDAITIIDYYVREYDTETIYRLSNDRAVNQEELNQLIAQSAEIEPMYDMTTDQEGDYAQDDEQPDAEPQAGEEQFYDNGELVRIEAKRQVKIYRVKHYKIAGDYVLDESDFPASKIPVIFVDQNSYYDKNGRQVCRPYMIDAKDAQRYLNYLGTQSAYMLKVSRYDQFLVCKDNVRGNDTQQIWRDPARVQGALYYDRAPNGEIPKQLRPPELSQSLLTQYQRAQDDIYTSTGLYAARVGQQGSEVSGAAVDARTRQGSYTTYVAFNSINRAIAEDGVIVNEMIPKVYDTYRVLNLVMPDTGLQAVPVNSPVDEYSQEIDNDLRKGEFEVRLLPGASFEGQKAEARESLEMILRANPQLLNLIADLYAENLPLANTIEIKNRLKAIVPPEIIEAGKTGKVPDQKNKQPSPEEEAAKMAAQAKIKDIELKQQRLMLDAEKMQHDMEMEMQKLETDRLEAAARLEGQQMGYDAEMHRTRTQEQIAHANNLVKLLTTLRG